MSDEIRELIVQRRSTYEGTHEGIDAFITENNNSNSTNDNDDDDDDCDGGDAPLKHSRRRPRFG